jgi:hypothetical protein
MEKNVRNLEETEIMSRNKSLKNFNYQTQKVVTRPTTVGENLSKTRSNFKMSKGKVTQPDLQGLTLDYFNFTSPTWRDKFSTMTPASRV